MLDRTILEKLLQHCSYGIVYGIICLRHIRKMMFSFQNICRENSCWGNMIRLHHHCSFFLSEIEYETCFVHFIGLELQENGDYIFWS